MAALLRIRAALVIHPQRAVATAIVLVMVTALHAAERNIVLFVTDDESPTLGCYGDPVAVTPGIDEIARDGVRFTHAFATTASCSASRSVILSGLHNHKTGQYGHQHHYHKFASYYDLASLSLPRVLSNAGYRTARCGKYHVAPELVFKFDQQIAVDCRNPVQMVESCRSFIEADDERPFFLYVATCDPHRSAGIDRSSARKLKPNLFGNKANNGAYPGVEEVFYDPAKVPVPGWLPDTPETREELAHYYQSCSRVDAGIRKLIELLQHVGAYEQTMIVFTSDHGMAFSGAKTTVYDAGLRVPLVVRNPYEPERGTVSETLVSHIDITPTLVDFAGALDRDKNAPAQWQPPKEIWRSYPHVLSENRHGNNQFDKYHGKSWLHVLGNISANHHQAIFASHTFHEITMYYPMRAIHDRKYKLIWNLAHGLPYPFASDLWTASSWQAQYRRGSQARYGGRSVSEYIHRPAFELYDVAADPHESRNLATEPDHAHILAKYQQKLRKWQKEHDDPWQVKWEYE